MQPKVSNIFADKKKTKQYFIFRNFFFIASFNSTRQKKWLSQLA